MLQSYIPDTRDAWSYTLDTLRGFFEQVMARQVDLHEIALPPSLLTAALEAEVPDLAYETIGSYLITAELLGQRTAELHLALFSDTRDPNFAPEPFSSFYQRSIYQYMRNLSGQVLLLLKKQLNQLPPETQHLAQMVLNQRDILLGRFRFVLDQKITAMRTRCHGNYSLKEVLYTGKDFVIIDFEGEPERPLSERRMKRSPLRDVAGMIHSLYDASRIAFLNEVESGMVREENYHLMDQWAHFIYAWTGVVFLKQYLAIIQDSKCLPQAIQELQVLLDAYLLEKAVYELGSTLNENQTQIDIQLQRLLELLQSSRMSHWKT
jgi:maltose alpha-D-glucosyltransferase/alpha-amylase